MTSATSKLLSNDIYDFSTDSSFVENPPKGKKLAKRQRPAKAEESYSISNINNTVAVKEKKTEKKTGEKVEECHQKLTNFMTHQVETSKKCNENFMMKLSDIISHVEADYSLLKNNQQKFERMIPTFMKCTQQATVRHTQTLNSLKEIQMEFKKECEEMETDQRTQTETMGREIEDDIKRLQERLISETKKSDLKNLYRAIDLAMREDL